MDFEVSMSIVIQLLRYASAKGIDSAEILRAAGLNPGLAESPDQMIGIRDYNRIQEAAAGMTADDYFGLHMGEYAVPASWNMVGYIMMNCPTLGRAIEKSSEYHEIVGSMIRVDCRVKDGLCFLDIVPTQGAYGHTQHCYEAIMSSTVRIIRSLIGDRFSLDRAGFGIERPEDTSEYSRVFDCDLEFGALVYYLAFDKAFLEQPVIQSNSGILSILEQHAGRYLGELKQSNAVTRKVSRLIVEKMQGSDFGIDSVAGELAMSVRSLQEKLKAENTTYSGILRDVRETLSKEYLSHSPCSVSEIAYMMGFSEPGVFVRSFKKWTGTTPGAYRNSFRS
ncbi:MAG: AraC family transcriptional regulator [Desulfobacter sp.]|nr:MAG: AraC family transcriptional regulator [Desulfobacter sp.]